MKRFLVAPIVVLTLLGAVNLSMAAWVESFNQASSTYTITSEGPAYIPQTLPGTVLLYVNVSSPSTNGTLKIYNSSGLASGQIANIDLGARDSYRYEIVLSSGLTYTTTGNVGGVTIIYKRTRP